jgi:hypothetical protein
MVGRSRIAMLVTVLAVVVLVSGCALGDAPPPAGVRPDGFPTGVFEKTYDDPDFGPMRLSWVFAANGDWAGGPRGHRRTDDRHGACARALHGRR